MATLIPESISFASSSNRSSCPTPAISSSPSLSLSVRRSSCFLPEFSGLKIRFRPNRTSVSLDLRNSRVSRRRGVVVCEAQETAVDIPTVNDYTWQSLILKAEGPVLVEFWAPWCGPCRMIHPVISDLAEQYAGQLKCFKLNTDESPSIATEYGVRSIPTIMIFNNGEKKDAIMGGVPKTTLTACIEKNI